MGLQGDLRNFHLTDILQLLHMGKQTGAIHIDRDDTHGVIYLENGEALHAKIGEHIRGEKAVFQILQWKEGEFVFFPNEKTEKRTIKMNVQNLIMEGTRQIDEWGRLRDQIPSLDAIVKFNSDQGGTSGTNISLQPKEWKILSLVNGVRTIREISSQSRLSEFETCKILYGLLSSGLLSIDREEIPPEITEEETKIIRDGDEETSEEEPSKSSLWKNLFGGKKKEPTPSPATSTTTSREGSPLEAMAVFINSLLDDYETPKHLFPAVNFSMPLAKRVRKYEQKFPAMKHVLVKNNRIDINHAEAEVQSGGAEQQDILFGLGDIANDLLEDGKTSLTPRSAVNRYNDVFDNVLKDEYDVRKLALGAFVKKASI